MNNIAGVIISPDFVNECISKEEAYSKIKILIDKAFDSNIDKCVTDVCHVPLSSLNDITPDEVHELQEVAEDLCFYISQARDLGLHSDILDKIRAYFSHINMTIDFHSEIAPVSMLLKRFYSLIVEYHQEFKNLTPLQIDLMIGFMSDLKRWVNITFKDHNLNELDDTLRANLEQIEAMIKPVDDNNELEFF